jgi:hypothetical protein
LPPSWFWSPISYRKPTSSSSPFIHGEARKWGSSSRMDSSICYPKAMLRSSSCSSGSNLACLRYVVDICWILLDAHTDHYFQRATPPTGAEMINSGVVFVLMVCAVYHLCKDVQEPDHVTQAVGAGPDPTLGIFLIYDLFALISGTTDGSPWRQALQYTILFVTLALAWDISAILFCEEGNNFSSDEGITESEDHTLEPAFRVFV